VYEVSKELVARGHSITVYTTDVYDKDNRLQGQTDGVVNVDGIRVRYFRNVSNRLAYGQIFIPPSLIPAINNEVMNYDVVHLNCCYNPLNVIAHHYAKKHDVPFVLSAQGTLDPVRRKLKSKRKEIYEQLFGRNILRDLSKAIAVSKAEVEQFMQMGVDEKKIEIVPNGILLSEFQDLPTRGTFRTKYSLRDHDRIMLFLGRIHRIKGLDLLVRTFSDLVKGLDALKLVIVGPGEDELYLRSIKKMVAAHEIGDRVLFTGLLAGREKLCAYVDADVFVLPSHSEGLPMTVLEACASGTPVLISEQCNVPEVSDFEAGFVITNDRTSLLTALREILSEPGLRWHLGSNGKRMVEECFTWQAVVDKLEQVYASTTRRTLAVDKEYHHEQKV